VLINLIREKLDASQNKYDEQSIQIFTLFSDKTYLTVDERKIPIIVAMPRWINGIFVYFSQSFDSHFFQHLEQVVFDEDNIKHTEKERLQKMKEVLNSFNTLMMMFL